MSNLPFHNNYFIEVDCKMAMTSKQEIEDYNRQLEEYEQELEDWGNREEIFRLSGAEKPKRPVLHSEQKYVKIWCNFGEFVIKLWQTFFDDTINEEVILIFYTEKTTGITSNMSLRMSKERWMKLLTNFGAYHEST